MARLPHILIIDDDVHWLERIREGSPTLKSIAEQGRFVGKHREDHVEFAASPHEAAERVAKRHFDLVIADIKFPNASHTYSQDITEFAVCRLLREARTPVVLLSQYAGQAVGQLNVLGAVVKNNFNSDMEGVLTKVLAHLGLSNGTVNSEEITWLHLSDLHHGFTPGAHQDRRVVEGAFLQDLEEMEEHFDLIVLSGDIAWSGKRHEYAEAAAFLGRVLEKTSLDASQLLMVPGNHDLDLSLVSKTLREMKRPSTRKQISDRLADAVFRASTLDNFTAYRQFAQALGAGPASNSDATGFSFKDEERKLLLVGMNSALASGLILDAAGNPDDKGSLFIGEESLMEALRGYGPDWLRVVIMHHPVHWMAECESGDLSRLLHDHCDLLIHGHLHRSEFHRVMDMRSQLPIVAGGSLFEGRDLVNSYNVTTLNVRTSRLDVRYRRFSDTQRTFVRDLDATGDRLDGRYIATLRPH